MLPGTETIKPALKERKFTKFFRKGIYVNKELSKNQIIEKKNIIIRRPENKVKPKMYSKLIGRMTKKKMNLNDPIDLKKIY